MSIPSELLAISNLHLIMEAAFDDVFSRLAKVIGNVAPLGTTGIVRQSNP